MAGRLTCQRMACVLVLVVGGWHGAIAAESPFADDGVEEELPDVNRVKAMAESGRARSQTQLADFYLAIADFTNAVLWYRRAADQGEVSAQLSLAGCLITGRGTARNPAEAARVLRLAADTIESAGAIGQVAHAVASPTVSAPSAPAALIPGRPVHSIMVTTASAPPQASTTLTNLPRVRRVETLLVVEPVLDSTQPALTPRASPR